MNKYKVESAYNAMNQTRTSRLKGQIVNKPRNRNVGSFSFALTFTDSPRAKVVFKDDDSSDDDENNYDSDDEYQSHDGESQSEGDYSVNKEKRIIKIFQIKFNQRFYIYFFL